MPSQLSRPNGSRDGSLGPIQNKARIKPLSGAPGHFGKQSALSVVGNLNCREWQTHALTGVLNHSLGPPRFTLIFLLLSFQAWRFEPAERGRVAPAQEQRLRHGVLHVAARRRSYRASAGIVTHCPSARIIAGQQHQVSGARLGWRVDSGAQVHGNSVHPHASRQ